jgi:adenylate kinase
MKPIVICVIGSPSSGKRTQAWELAQYLHIPHATMGKMVARLSSKNTELGQELQGIIRSGGMIGKQYFEALFDSLLTEYSSTGAIIDGFPRTEEQVGLLTQHLEDLGRLIVIDLYLTPEETFHRIRTLLLQPEYVPQISDRPEILKEKLFLYGLNHSRIQKLFQKASTSENCHYTYVHADKEVQVLQKELQDLLGEYGIHR